MISYAIVDKQAHGGVMITASHNPPRYNGIKLKAAYGGSATASVAKAVEARIDNNHAAPHPTQANGTGTALAAGLVTRFDPLPAYEAHIRTLVDFERIRRARMNDAPVSVAVDAMYGTGRIYLRRLLEDAGCAVTELRSEMNPGFNGIHPEPIARHLAAVDRRDGGGSAHHSAWRRMGMPTASAQLTRPGASSIPIASWRCCSIIWSTIAI